VKIKSEAIEQVTDTVMSLVEARLEEVGIGSDKVCGSYWEYKVRVQIYRVLIDCAE